MKHSLTITVAIIALAFLLASCKTRVFGTEIGFQPAAPRPSTTVTVVEGLPTPTPEALPPTPSASATPLAVTGVVCFGEIESGNLRVRECPGLACSEIGLLANGDQVDTNGERKDVDGSTWLRLAAPIDGWVNSRYICQPEAK